MKIEEIFRDFLETLKKDSEFDRTEFLFRFIEEMLGTTMKLGKDGYVPAVGLTLYARQGMGNMTEMIFHPYMSDNMEIYQKLQLSKFNQKLQDIIEAYGKEVWGMTPVDERNDVRDIVRAASNFEIQWGNVIKKQGED